MTKFLTFFILALLVLVPNANAQFVSSEAEQRARGSVLFNQTEEEAPRIIAEPKAYKPNLEFKIAIVINGEMVTSEDINNRIKAFSFITQIPLNAETIEMIKDRVIQNTIDEKIKLQEAEKEGLFITDREIEDSIENFAQGSNVTSQKFKQDLAAVGVSLDTFKEQMKSDLSWVRLVRKKTFYEIEANQNEINEAIKQAKTESGLTKYMLSEIVISKKAARNLDDLVYNLRNDSRFGLYAMQFSEAPSASRGGELGWINKGKLFTQLERAISKMSEGEVSDPIEVGTDYYILKLEKKYNPVQGKAPIPSEKEMKSMIEGKRLEEFATGYINKLRQKSIVEVKD